jgi:hypothetical protein
MSRKKSNCFYIYILRRPDLPDPYPIWESQPFYVGKGKKERIHQHRIETKRFIEPGNRINILTSMFIP